MPAAVEVVDGDAMPAIETAFAYFTAVDDRFSTYKLESEISRINRGEITESARSDEMREIIALAQQTKEETHGFFDICTPAGTLDPSGVVKGWAIRNAARIIAAMGHEDYYVEIGGDIQSHGKNAGGTEWSVGIQNPLKADEIVKVVYPHGKGIATSGTAARGGHIYNPHAPQELVRELASITVIGPDVFEADRFATAAFVMGARGAAFIESLEGFEAYAIDPSGIATMTGGFAAYTIPG